MSTTILYGMTRSSEPGIDYRARWGYIPMCDGWKRLPDGRMPAQDMIVFEVEEHLLRDLTPAQVAERVFIATNTPGLAMNETDQLLVELHQQWIGEAALGYQLRFVAGADEGRYQRATSIGDTVTIEGHPSVACLARGWVEIA